MTPPFGGWLTFAGGTADGVYYTYVLNTGDYRLSSLSLSGSRKLLVVGSARPLVASVYAPAAVCNLTSAGGGAAEMSGLIISQSVELGADVRLHLDLDLGRQPAPSSQEPNKRVKFWVGKGSTRSG